MDVGGPHGDDEDQRWIVVTRSRVRIAMNLSGKVRAVRLEATASAVLAGSSPCELPGQDGLLRLPQNSVAVLRSAAKVFKAP